MKKNFSVGIVIVCLTFLLSGCGNHNKDYIKKYSKELKIALGEYTFVKKQAHDDFTMDNTHFFTTNYLEWEITYSTPNGSTQTFILSNNDNISFYSQINDECIRNLKSEVKVISEEAGWDDNMIIDIELDEIEKDDKFMLYPAYTDLKKLTSKYDCSINLGVDYGFDSYRLIQIINKLKTYNNKVNIRVYCDLLGRYDIDPFEDDRFEDIYVYKKGKCILDKFVDESTNK